MIQRIMLAAPLSAFDVTNYCDICYVSAPPLKNENYKIVKFADVKYLVEVIYKTHSIENPIREYGFDNIMRNIQLFKEDTGYDLVPRIILDESESIGDNSFISGSETYPVHIYRKIEHCNATHTRRHTVHSLIPHMNQNPS
jgi:hypothetical protein